MYNSKLKTFYTDDLQNNFIPFWEKAMDLEFGGVYTCYDNNGAEKVSDRKYIWSQGRFLWVICSLLKLQSQGEITLSENWQKSAELTYSFLREHALMDNNHCVFAVEKDGSKIASQMDTSIFADCFYVLGCNAYATLQEDPDIFQHAFQIYEKIKERIENGDFKSDPYPIPKGYHSHSIPMILLNVAEELYQTASYLKSEQVEKVKTDVEMYLARINEFIDDKRIVEMTDFREKTLLSSHYNPGHTIECSWFMLHSKDHIMNLQSPISLEKVEDLVEEVIEKGWDPEHGGLFRFASQENGKPHGELIHTPYEVLIEKTWDTKLWWPHAEALYTTLLLYKKTGKEKWLAHYQKMEAYVFKTFPNPTQEIGEWIQIRNREGEPLEEVVALPVKDPFHIIRSYVLIIELLKETPHV